MSELPSGWVATTIGETCSIVSGSTPKSTEDSYWNGDIPWITPDDLSRHQNKTIFSGRRSITQAGFASCSTRMVPAGTILFTSRAPIGYAAIAAQPVCTNQGFKSLIPPSEISSDYLYWYMRYATDMVKSRASGTTFAEISGKAMATIPLLLAPRGEQDRIVAAIEEQLSRIDAGVAALERAWKDLIRFRTAVLVNAFSRLEATLSATSGTELFAFVTSGSRGWAKYYSNDGPIFFRIGNVPRTGIDPDLTGVQRVNPPANAEGRRTRVQPGDLLISITADLGRVAVIPETLGEAYINQHLALARPIDGMVPRYLAWYLVSPFGLRQWDSLRRGATKIGLGLDDIRALRIPIPTPEIQQSTVDVIEAAWESVQLMEQSLVRCERRAQHLRSSLLTAAFSGRLVAQDPTDEPASVLLEQIAADRASSNGHKPLPRRKSRGRREEVIT